MILIDGKVAHTDREVIVKGDHLGAEMSWKRAFAVVSRCVPLTLDSLLKFRRQGSRCSCVSVYKDELRIKFESKLR